MKYFFFTINILVSDDYIVLKLENKGLALILVIFTIITPRYICVGPEVPNFTFVISDLDDSKGVFHTLAFSKPWVPATIGLWTPIDKVGILEVIKAYQKHEIVNLFERETSFGIVIKTVDLEPECITMAPGLHGVVSSLVDEWVNEVVDELRHEVSCDFVT